MVTTDWEPYAITLAKRSTECWIVWNESEKEFRIGLRAWDSLKAHECNEFSPQDASKAKPLQTSEHGFDDRKVHCLLPTECC